MSNKTEDMTVIQQIMVKDEVTEQEGEGGVFGGVLRTRTGIPITIIWLPYVGLSLVLIGLMLVSFIHFHKKNGHKYRRRAELLQKLQSRELSGPTSIHNQIVSEIGPANHNPRVESTPPNGGVNIQRQSTISESPPQSCKPQHNPFWPYPPPPSYVPPTSKTSSSRRKTSSSSQPSSSHIKRPPHAKRSKRPLEFTSNQNGSMVDVRCGTNESLKTFSYSLKEKPTHKTKDSYGRSSSCPVPPSRHDPVWTLPRGGASSSSSSTRGGGGYDPSTRGGGGYDPYAYQPMLEPEFTPTRAMPFSPSGTMTMLSDTEDSDQVYLLDSTQL